MAKRGVGTRRGAATTGRVLRPRPRVLAEAALIPPGSIVKPPPNQFTHEIVRAQPYFYSDPPTSPDGEFAAGTRVVLMVHDGGPRCRVVDEQGLYVTTAFDGLRPLTKR